VQALSVPLIGAIHQRSGTYRSRLAAQKFRGIDAATRVLVLANRTTDSTQPHQQLLARHAGGPITVTVLAPANWEVQNPHEGTAPAWRRLRAARKHLQAGGTSDGHAGCQAA
jgi:hypothetical protein